MDAWFHLNQAEAKYESIESQAQLNKQVVRIGLDTTYSRKPALKLAVLNKDVTQDETGAVAIYPCGILTQ